MKKVPVYLSAKEISDARVALTLAALEAPPEVAERLVKLIEKLGQELETFEEKH